jgi:hypothetical protein
LLGVGTEPEDLKKARLGTYEKIGRDLATECRNGTRGIWDHELLKENAAEQNRLAAAVSAFLFTP